jgi:hypothetical protein
MGLTPPIRAVTIELSQSRVEDIDPAATVDFFRERSFTTLVVFALGYLHGETYYPSQHAPMRNGLDGRDVFGEFVNCASAAGLDVVAYVNSFFGGPDAWEQHPDWTQRWADGRETTQGIAKGLCINSPYGERIVAAVAEVAERYAIAGVYLDEPSLQSWCACQHCRDRYRSDTGRDLPLDVAAGDPAFVTFLEWRSDVVAGFVDAAGRACRRARPGITFIGQHAFPLASTSEAHHEHLFWGRPSGRRPPQFTGWYRPSFYGQHIVREAVALDVVAIEPWRRFVGTPLWWQGAAVAYARAAGRGKPVLPLMEYPHFPWGLSRLTDDELEVNCADVVANGGELWWPMYAPGQADPSGWDRLRDVFADLDAIRPASAVEASSSAVLVSRRTVERYAMGDADVRYLDHLLGAIQLLRDLQRPYRVLSAEALTSDVLDGIDTLVAPVAACLDEREAGIVANWVQAGGHLVSIGPTGTHDETGQVRDRPLLAAVLGVEQLPAELHAGLGYLVATGATGRPGRIPARDAQLELRPVNADVLYEMHAMWDLFEPPPDVVGVPSVTRNRYGAGLADHIAIGLGRLRWRYELFEAAQLLAALLAPTPAAIRGAGVGPEVSLHVWQTESDTRVFLVNTTSVDRTGRCSTLGPQRLVVPAGTTVRSLRGGTTRCTTEDGEIVVELDRLGTWDCLVLSN